MWGNGKAFIIIVRLFSKRKKYGGHRYIGERIPFSVNIKEKTRLEVNKRKSIFWFQVVRIVRNSCQMRGEAKVQCNPKFFEEFVEFLSLSGPLYLIIPD